MQKVLGVFLLLCCLSLGCNSDKQKKSNQNEEKTMLFSDLDGLPVSLDQFHGKRVLVNFWAGWCVPCLKEFPSLIEAQELLLDDNFVFLFPSPDAESEIRVFAKTKGYPLRFLSLRQSLDKLNIHALPATIIYTTSGDVYKKIDGSRNWSSPEIIEMLKSVP